MAVMYTVWSFAHDGQQIQSNLERAKKWQKTYIVTGRARLHISFFFEVKL